MTMDTGARLPLSPAQFGLWWQERRAGGQYTVTEMVDLHGLLVVPALMAALRAVHTSHPALRTVVGVQAGLPFQEPGAGGELDVDVVDADGRTECGHGIAPVDLATGDCQRARIVRFGPHWHRLIVVTHHLVTDAHSWRRVLLPQIAQAYAVELGVGALPPSPERTVADYLAWRSGLESSDDYARRCDAVSAAVAEGPDPVDPVHRNAVTVAGSTEGRSFAVAADPAAWARRCRTEAGVSPLAVLMAASSVAAAAALRSPAPLVSCRVTDRPGPDYDDVCGMFVNAVPYRLPVGEATVGDLVSASGNASTTLLRARHAAFGDVERRHAALTGRRTLAVDAMMTYTPHDELAPRFLGLHAAPVERAPDMSFPLELSFYVVGGMLQASVYATPAVERAALDAAAARAEEFCAVALDRPDTVLSTMVGEVLA